MQLIDGSQSFPISAKPQDVVLPNPNIARQPDPALPSTVGIQVIPAWVSPPNDGNRSIGSDSICRVVDVVDLDRAEDITLEVAPTIGFVQTLLGRQPRLEAVSHETFVHTQQSHGISTNMLLSAADLCFQAHLPLGLRPEVLWQTILSQVAILVKQNPEAYRNLFTRSSEKTLLRVRHDGLRMGDPWGWDQAIGMFREPLTENVPGDLVELALPDDMSTVGTSETLGCLVTFMDAASPFYEYRVQTMCGIPKVALFGAPEDWRNLQNRTSRLAAKFPYLCAYFAAIGPIIAKLVDAAEGAPIEKATVDPSRYFDRVRGGDSFWTSVYKRDSGSGGDKLSGWLTSFFAFTRAYETPELVLREDFNWRTDRWGGINPSHFPGSASVVDFIWEYFGTEHKMKFVGGVTATVRIQADEGEFITPRLGWAVAHAG